MDLCKSIARLGDCCCISKQSKYNFHFNFTLSQDSENGQGKKISLEKVKYGRQGVDGGSVLLDSQRMLYGILPVFFTKEGWLTFLFLTHLYVHIDLN